MDLIDLIEYIEYPLKFEEKIGSFLIRIRNVIEKGFFTSYYDKLQLQQQIETLASKDSLNSMIKQFSFIQICDRPSSACSKTDVYDILKTSSAQKVILLCLEMFFIFNRHAIRKGKGQVNNNLLLTLVDNVLSSILTFKRSDLFNMDYIDELMNDFVVYLIGSINLMDEDTFKNEKVSQCHFLLQLLKKFRNVDSAQRVIIKEISKIIANLNNLAQDNNKLDPYQSETFLMLLYLLLDIFEHMSLSNKNMPQLNYKSERYICNEQQICEALKNRKFMLPDYIEEVVDTCVKKFFDKKL